MTTASSLTPPSPEAMEVLSRQRPRPLSTLTAAATRLTTGRSVTGPGRRHTKSDSWQGDAWETYDQVGEQRFLASTLANRMSQARLYVGELPDNLTDEPVPLEDGLPFDVFRALQQTPAAMAQMIRRWGVLLFIPGEAYLVGVPSAEDDRVPEQNGLPDWLSPLGPGEDTDGDGVPLDRLEWHALSEDEVSVSDDDTVTLTIAGESRVLQQRDCWVVRIHRPHPRLWIEPDSPTRSSLPVLRELIGLTMHISAQVDSRLAGAGVFLVPQEAAREIRKVHNLSDEEDVAEDLTAMLMEAMITPIADRSNASALVPLVLEVPGENIDQFRHITFATPLDAESRELREEAIRRLALGQDCPPELLLGVSGMNHWGAWLVREDVVTTHIEPPLSLICDALTTQYLWPVLQQQGMAPEEFQRYAIWYSVEHLIIRPNRGTDAMALYDKGELSGEALRDYLGFSDADAPAIEEDTQAMDPAVQLAFDMVRAAPSLAQNPGLPALVASIRDVLAGTDSGAIDPDSNPADEPTADGGPDPDEGGDEENTAEEVEGDIPATSDDEADPVGDGGGLSASGDQARLTVTGYLGDAIRRSGDDDDRAADD